MGRRPGSPKKHETIGHYDVPIGCWWKQLVVVGSFLVGTGVPGLRPLRPPEEACRARREKQRCYLGHSEVLAGFDRVRRVVVLRWVRNSPCGTCPEELYTSLSDLGLIALECCGQTVDNVSGFNLSRYPN